MVYSNAHHTQLSDVQQQMLSISTIGFNLEIHRQERHGSFTVWFRCSKLPHRSKSFLVNKKMCFIYDLDFAYMANEGHNGENLFSPQNIHKM